MDCLKRRERKCLKENRESLSKVRVRSKNTRGLNLQGTRIQAESIESSIKQPVRKTILYNNNFASRSFQLSLSILIRTWWYWSPKSRFKISRRSQFMTLKQLMKTLFQIAVLWKFKGAPLAVWPRPKPNYPWLGSKSWPLKLQKEP